MPDLAYDLRYLEYAMVAAEFGSFRRAAEALELSQSTLMFGGLIRVVVVPIMADYVALTRRLYFGKNNVEG